MTAMSPTDQHVPATPQTNHYDNLMFSSLFVCLLGKTSKPICMKFSGKVGNGPINNLLNFGGNPDHNLYTGIVSGFVTIGRYGKWYSPTALHDAPVHGIH